MSYELGVMNYELSALMRQIKKIQKLPSSVEEGVFDFSF
jgi:hypothetical protein